jgi:hypothetical protein
MSEEQVKAADAEATEQEEESVEEISEDDLEGVAGGFAPGVGAGENDSTVGKVGITCCGHDPCLGPLAGCNSEATAD